MSQEQKEGSRPQLLRDLREVEGQLRFTRGRLTYYECSGEQALTAHTRRVVQGLEQVRATLIERVLALGAAPAG